MKQDGRDLIAEFRALAPARRPIALQRWSVRRVVYALRRSCSGFCSRRLRCWSSSSRSETATSRSSPDCGTNDLMVLMAQAVPDAVSIPCIASLPTGWELEGVTVHQDAARFWLSSDRGGSHAVEVRLQRPSACVVDGATAVPTDELGTRRFEAPDRLPPDLQSTRYYLFDGGCVTYRFAFAGDASASLMFDVDRALAFQPREPLVDWVRDRSGLRLCGVGAPCPGGS